MSEIPIYINYPYNTPYKNNNLYNTHLHDPHKIINENIPEADDKIIKTTVIISTIFYLVIVFIFSMLFIFN
jgi:hypothetical protein